MLKNLKMAYLLTELPYLGKSIHFLMEIWYGIETRYWF